MARVFRRSGKWWLDFNDLNRKRRRETTTATTKEEANALLRKVMSDMTKATLLGVHTREAVKPILFSTFVDEEYLPHQKATKRESSYKRDLLHAEKTKAEFGSRTLRSINAGDIERFITRMLSSKTYKDKAPAPATCNRVRSFLSAALNMARRRGYIDRNPVQDVKKLREDNEQDRYLRPQEELDILAEASEFLRPIMTFAVNTGMRLGELVNLKWADIDQTTGFIRVDHTSKGHKTRHIPINLALKAVLATLKPSRSEEGFIPFVFVNERFKKPYKASSVYNAFKAAASRANVQGVVFHTLRHTAVSRMVAAGIPDRVIMKIVGHSTPHMVTRYAHLAPQSLKGATDSLAVGTNPAPTLASVK
jgi:integrase